MSQNERRKKVSSLTYHPSDNQPTAVSEKIRRKKKRNGRTNSRRQPEIQEDVNQELSMRQPNHGQDHSLSFQQQQPSNSSLQSTPENRMATYNRSLAGGFFAGSKYVDIAGGTFTQTHGTSLTVHLHQPHTEVEHGIQPQMLPLTPSPSSSSSSLSFSRSPEQPPIRESSGPTSQAFLSPAHAQDIHHSQISSEVGNIQNPLILRREYDWNKIYTTQLLLENRGYPLWIPEPSGTLPLCYQRQGTRIGDVGILTPSGGFSFLFNICLPSDHLINYQRVPDGFAPIYPQVELMDITKFREFKDMDYLASPAIEKVNDSSFIGLSFQTSTADGAILTLPEGATRFDLENTARFRTYAAANIEDWYRYVNGPRRGREVKNGEIRLVIGCDKATSWGIAAVASPPQPKIHYLRYGSTQVNQMISTSSARLHDWEHTGPVRTKVGPDRIDIEELSRNDDSNLAVEGKYCNQCLFVRTLNPTLDDEVFARISQEIQSPLIQESQQSNPSNSSSISSNLSNGESQNTTSQYSTSLGTQRGSACEPSDRSTGQILIGNIARTSFTTSTTPTTIKFHPADFLNKSISHKVSKCRVVITQDHDWCSIISENDKTMPSPEEIAERVFAAYDFREEDGVVFLEPKETQSMILRRQIPSSTSVEDQSDLEHAIERPPGSIVSTSPASNDLEQGSLLSPANSLGCLAPSKLDHSFKSDVTPLLLGSSSQDFPRWWDPSVDSRSSKYIQHPKEIGVPISYLTSRTRDVLPASNYSAPGSPRDPVSKGAFKRERSLSVQDIHSPTGLTAVSKDPEEIRRTFLHQLKHSKSDAKLSSHPAPKAWKPLSPAAQQSAERRRKTTATFICDFCGATFTRNHNRLNHMRTHTGDGGVTCLFCGRHFSQKSSLSRHLKRCKMNTNHYTTSESKSASVQAAVGSEISIAYNGQFSTASSQDQSELEPGIFIQPPDSAEFVLSPHDFNSTQDHEKQILPSPFVP